MFVWPAACAFQVTIGAAGGIDMLLGVMQAHPKQVNVQQYACEALDMLHAHATNKVYYFPLFFKQDCIPWADIDGTI